MARGRLSCQVDARLEDLRALADLGGPGAPELAGRMSVNGALSAPPGPQQEIDGYLNVEGSRLLLRGAPLDYLRSTLVFKDGGLRVADLQATHGGDYFTGTGSMRLDGPPHYEGELRVQAGQLAVYTPGAGGFAAMRRTGAHRGPACPVAVGRQRSALRAIPGSTRYRALHRGRHHRLHDAGDPVMNLSFDGKNVLLRSIDGQGHTRAECALTMRGEVGNVPALGGNVRLLGGDPGVRLELFPCSGEAMAGMPYTASHPSRSFVSTNGCPSDGKHGRSI